MNKLKLLARMLTLVTAFFIYALLLPGASETRVQDKRKGTPPFHALPSVNKVVLNNIPIVTLQDVVRWNDIVQSRNGIAGNDFFGVQRLGLAPAESKCALDTFNEWFPIEDTPNYGAKKCVCGALLDYSQTGSDNGEQYLNNILDLDDLLHDEAFCDHDYDLNIAPSPHFNDLLARATNLSPSWRNKIHAEIDLPFGINPRVFSLETGYLKQATGQTWCVYGPWVIDDNRGSDYVPPGDTLARKVEIHPAEQIWWGNQQGAILVSTADYSSRYNNRNDFDTDDGSKTYTQPWAQTPLQSRYAVAFEIKPGAPKLWYFVATMNADNMTVASNDGREHELVVREPGGERPLVTVVEKSSSDFTNIGFQDVKRRKDGTIQGYITISSSVGGPINLGGLGALGKVFSLSGGHIMHWIARGETPSEYSVQILTVERLAKNSYSYVTGGKRVYFPVNPLPPGYNETLAKFTLETSSQSQQIDLPVNVGEIKSLPSFRQNGTKGPFDFVASFSLKAQDGLAKNVGFGSSSVSTRDFGKTRTIQLKMIYPSPRPDALPPGSEPPRPGPPGGTVLYRRLPGSLVVEEMKFKVTYVVTPVRSIVNPINPR